MLLTVSLLSLVSSWTLTLDHSIKQSAGRSLDESRRSADMLRHLHIGSRIENLQCTGDGADLLSQTALR
jgi:hypothetical protein